MPQKNVRYKFTISSGENARIVHKKARKVDNEWYRDYFAY